MNEIDLTKILKDCPKGTKLYTTVYGEVTFDKINNKRPDYPINVKPDIGYINLTKEGRYTNKTNADCILFPSKEQRDWSKFTAPWYKKEQVSSLTNERTWLYLVSDVLTWKDGIGQYLDDPRVQEIAKRLCDKYAQKLYNPSVLSNSSNTGKDEQKSADKVESKFKVGDWVVRGDIIAQILDIQEQYYVGLDINGKDFVSSRFLNDDKIHLWTIKDTRDGDVIHRGAVTAILKKYIGKETCICYCSFCKDGGFKIPIENGDDNVYGCYNATPATKEQRDFLFQKIKEAGYKWNAETKTLEKLVSDKFNPKTLKPFDKVLCRNGLDIWRCDFFSSYMEIYVCPNVCIGGSYLNCIPYNDDTKHLVGTYDKAPEYYRYWED